MLTFEESQEWAKTNVEKLGDSDKLDLYGMFKQATVGDCNTPSPGMFDFKGSAKWNAWNGKKGTSKEVAELFYIRKVEGLSK